MKGAHMWRIWVGLCLLTGTLAQSVVPDELLCGYSKGYARGSKFVPSRNEATFTNAHGQTMLTLRGIAAVKWHQWEPWLGPCYRSQPELHVVSGKGIKGTIYRFRGGIIVAYKNQAFFVPRDEVMAWEITGGYKGKLGFPTSDPEPYKLPPPLKKEDHTAAPCGLLF